MTTPETTVADVIKDHWTSYSVDAVGDYLECDCGERFSGPTFWAKHLIDATKISELAAEGLRQKQRADEQQERADNLAGVLARIRAADPQLFDDYDPEDEDAWDLDEAVYETYGYAGRRLREAYRRAVADL